VEAANLRFKRLAQCHSNGLLGEGTFSLATRVWDSQAGTLVVGKMFRSGIRQWERREEVALLQAVAHAGAHPAIVRARAIAVQGSSVETIYFDHWEHSLHDRWMLHGGCMLRTETVAILIQCIDGLRFSRATDIWHRDLKPQNILVKCTTRGLRACLADLGLARKVIASEQHHFTPGVTTWPFRALEVSLGMEYSSAVDVWSLGVGLRELLSGEQVWRRRESRHDTALMAAMRVGGLIEQETWPEAVKSPAWRTPPADFRIFTDIEDAFSRNVPAALAEVVRQMLQVLPGTGDH